MELSRRFMPLLRSLAVGRWIFAINMSRLTGLPRYSGGFSTEPRMSTIVRLSVDAFECGSGDVRVDDADYADRQVTRSDSNVWVRPEIVASICGANYRLAACAPPNILL